MHDDYRGLGENYKLDELIVNRKIKIIIIIPNIII